MKKLLGHVILLYLYDKTIIKYDVFKKLIDVIYGESYIKVDTYLLSLKGKGLGEKTYDFVSKIACILGNYEE